MTENRGALHWTEDADLLERYALGRVEPLQQRVLEEHTAGCSACRQAVKEERLLVAGIRRAGRAEMKRRLRSRLGEARERRVPVWQVASAAAGIMLLIGVGIYNDWFTSAKHGDTLTTPPVAQAPVQEQKEERLSTKETVTPAPALTGNSRALKSGSAEKAFREKGKPSSPPSDYLKAEVAQPRKDIAAAAGDARAKEPRELTDAEAPADATRSLWVEGTYLTPPESGSTLSRRSDAKRQERISEKSGNAQPAEGPHSEMNPGTMQQGFVVAQRPAAMLPVTQQRQQSKSDKPAVQTRIRSENGVTHLTLYVDPLFGTDELRNATVQLVTDDSIQIVVGQRLIGYRLPPGWTATHQQAPAIRR